MVLCPFKFNHCAVCLIIVLLEDNEIAVLHINNNVKSSIKGWRWMATKRRDCTNFREITAWFWFNMRWEHRSRVYLNTIYRGNRLYFILKVDMGIKGVVFRGWGSWGFQCWGFGGFI